MTAFTLSDGVAVTLENSAAALSAIVSRGKATDSDIQVMIEFGFHHYTEHSGNVDVLTDVYKACRLIKGVRLGTVADYVKACSGDALKLKDQGKDTCHFKKVGKGEPTFERKGVWTDFNDSGLKETVIDEDKVFAFIKKLTTPPKEGKGSKVTITPGAAKLGKAMAKATAAMRDVGKDAEIAKLKAEIKALKGESDSAEPKAEPTTAPAAAPVVDASMAELDAAMA